MGPGRFLNVVMEFDWPVWVLIRSCAFLLVFIGPYSSGCVLMDSIGFLWVVIGPYLS